MNVFRDPSRINLPGLTSPGAGGLTVVRDTMFANAVSYRENYHKKSAAGSTLTTAPAAAARIAT